MLSITGLPEAWQIEYVSGGFAEPAQQFWRPKAAQWRRRSCRRCLYYLYNPTGGKGVPFGPGATTFYN